MQCGSSARNTGTDAVKKCVAQSVIVIVLERAESIRDCSCRRSLDCGILKSLYVSARVVAFAPKEKSLAWFSTVSYRTVERWSNNVYLASRHVVKHRFEWYPKDFLLKYESRHLKNAHSR